MNPAIEVGKKRGAPGDEGKLLNGGTNMENFRFGKSKPLVGLPEGKLEMWKKFNRNVNFVLSKT